MSFCARLCTVFVFVLGSSLLLAADRDTGDKTKHSFPRVRLGGVFVNAGYSRFSGGYPYWGYGPYGFDPFLFGPYIHPGFYTGFGYGPSLGEVKLQAADKSSWIYIDGALAGRAEKLKTMWLEPGAYSLEVRGGQGHPDEVLYSQKIYVLSGKTFKLTTAMMNAKGDRP